MKRIGLLKIYKVKTRARYIPKGTDMNSYYFLLRFSFIDAFKAARNEDFLFKVKASDDAKHMLFPYVAEEIPADIVSYKGIPDPD